jgi:hypothetical protein
VYSRPDTATCRSARMMFGIIPKITATNSRGNSNMNSRRVISVVYDRYREYAPNEIRLYR